MDLHSWTPTELFASSCIELHDPLVKEKVFLPQFSYTLDVVGDGLMQC